MELQLHAQSVLGFFLLSLYLIIVDQVVLSLKYAIILSDLCLHSGLFAIVLLYSCYI